ncbi:hypothetical protein RclHR1_04190014 [Rhizophagus clarus]|uniref:BTB/POZ domain-containing protein n=1 Tax=Rhizophagus clarus TaxID=94130 RepID=A0A2Z6RWW7_9GLOM|nr:hypothetical protein RclHR1_04190014 [Rhizophagus clarus]GES84920.1 BTB/POZ domain-containing protein [Rhizophagus clarus]
MILKFIYCGKIDVTNLLGSELLKLLIAADDLNIQILIICTQEYLIKHWHEFLQQNFTKILEMIHHSESFTELWNFYIDRICEEPEKLFNSDMFININANFLELLLRRDDLNLDEIIIWDCLIRWCSAQHSHISQNYDVKEWNEDNVTIMKRAIHRFIPLIRFYDISPEDFISKVFPYKELIPRSTYGSTLIERHHFNTLASWIDKKEILTYNIRNIPYNFNLLYRASRDGNTAAAFHSKCDNKGATIVVIKISNHANQIVGGYNPLQWDSSDRFMSTRDSFIFSFKTIGEVGYSISNQFSIGCYSAYGPMFGVGIDLYLNNDGWRSNKNGYGSYPKIDIPVDFNADDYEVFQVIKK